MAQKRAPKKGRLEEQLAALASACEAPDSDRAAAALDAALADERSALVASAASAIATHELGGWGARLAAAFERFMQQPEKSDKGCLAKTAIVRALYRAEEPVDDVYLRAVRHVQLEPVWGGKQDTAVELRVNAALALARRHHGETLNELARLLADREVMARIGAASAVGYHGHVDAGVPLLRFKVLSGDADARVIGAGVGALLALDPAQSLAFAGELLAADDQSVVEAVAIALGESRLPGAFPLLQRACDEAVLPEAREAAMVALAMLRSEDAFAHLLSIVENEALHRARAALKALAIFAQQEALTERVATVVRRRDDEPELQRYARELWGRALD
jgi:hypothetical protein